MSGNEKSEFSAHITIMTSTDFTSPSSDDDTLCNPKNALTERQARCQEPRSCVCTTSCFFCSGTSLTRDFPFTAVKQSTYGISGDVFSRTGIHLCVQHHAGQLRRARFVVRKSRQQNPSWNCQILHKELGASDSAGLFRNERATSPTDSSSVGRLETVRDDDPNLRHLRD